MIPLSIIGLSVVIIAWALEFLFMGKKKRISPIFISVYIFGVGILVYDGFTSGNNVLAVANLVSLVVSTIVLGKTLVETKGE
jgi:uncharacterized membrane protein YedE/YeeE